MITTTAVPRLYDIHPVKKKRREKDCQRNSCRRVIIRRALKFLAPLANIASKINCGDE